MPDPNSPQNDQIAQSLDEAATYAPTLTHSPNTAVTVASAGGNLEQSAQSVSHAQNMTALGQAANQENQRSGGGFWGALGALGHAVGRGLADAGGAALKVLNAPMQMAQHEFRYLVATEQQHGWGAALGEGAVMLAGAAALGAATGGLGDFALGDAAAAASDDLLSDTAGQVVSKAASVVGRAKRSGFYTGAQAGGFAAGHVMHTDLWNQTANSQWKDKGGNLVSFGREMAGFFGLSGGYKTAVSGAMDGIFDMVNGNLPGAQELSAIRSTEGGTGVFSAFKGYALNTDTLDYAIHNPQLYGDFHRAADIISKSKAGEIAKMFPGLNALGTARDEAGNIIEDAPGLITALDGAGTKDEVFDALRQYVHSKELMNGGRLPTMSALRQPVSQMRAALEDATPKLELAAGRAPGIGRALGPIAGSLSPVTWARRFTHTVGMDIDAAGQFVGHSVDFTQNRVPRAVMDMLQYGQGRKVAEHFGNDWVHADPVTRQVMFRNAHLDTLFGMMGHRLGPGVHATEDDLNMISDPAVRQRLAERLDQLSGAHNPDAAGRYGAYSSGAALKPLVDPETGRDIGGGVLLSQTGRGTVSDFTDLKRMAAYLKGGKDLYGRIDDQLFRHATSNFFKRFVLLSGGYVARISAAEDIPNMLRHGVKNMVAGAAHTAAARYGWEGFDPDQLNAFQHFVYDHFGDQMAHASAKLNQWKTDRAFELASMTGGDTVSTAVKAGHGGSPMQDPTQRIEGGLRQRSDTVRGSTRRSKQYTMFARDDKYHLRAWRTWMSQIKGDPMSRAAAREMHATYVAGGSKAEAQKAAEDVWRNHVQGMTDAQKEMYLQARMIRKDDPDWWSPADSWAHHGVQNLIAATHTEDGRLIPDMLRRISMPNERLPHVGELGKVPISDRPLAIPDRDFIPNGDTSAPARLATYGFDRIMNPMVNMMSRYSVMFNEYTKQYRVLESDIAKGVLDHDEAMTIAMSRASQESTKWIHNLHDRTQWSETMRNWAPFWFAKEQAYRRMGRLLAEDPAAFQRYSLMIQAVHNQTVKQRDPNSGQSYVMLPGEGFLTRTFNDTLQRAGIPIAAINPVELGGNFSSTSVVFPFSDPSAQQGFHGIGPDMGPVALVPAKLLYGAISSYGRRYAGFAPITGKIQGLETGVFGQTAINEQMINELLPNTALQRVFEAFQANDNTYDSVALGTIRTLDYEQNVAMAAWEKGGQKGPKPQIVPDDQAGYAAHQAFLSRIKNMTQMNLISRALLSIATPLTLETKVQDFGLPKELQDDIQREGSVTKGMDAFLKRNPLATPYTVAESTHPGSSAALPESMPGQQWLEHNQSLINEYPQAAVWLMPQALTHDPYSQTAYNEQLADGLRVKDTPQQFLDALYTAAGDQTYYAAYKEHKDTLQQAGNNANQVAAEYNNWSGYVQHLQKVQPTWFANTKLFSAAAQAESQQTIVQLKGIYAAGKAPAGQQSTLVKQLLDSFDQAASEYAQASSSYNYTTQVKYVREQWNAYLTNMKTTYPQLAPIISSVFAGALYPIQ